MRPDLDEYEELTTEAGEPRGRAMSWVVLGVAVLGFSALAYYAYQSGSQSAANGEMMTVSAEPGAIKETPAEPGGEQFPHKDKTIYDALSTYRTDEEGSTEKLLPTAEEPVIPEPAVGNAQQPATKPADTTTYVSNNQPPADEPSIADPAKTIVAVVEPKKMPEAPVTKTDAPVPVAKPLTPVAAPASSAPAPLEKVEVKDATVKTTAVPVTTKNGAPVVAQSKPVTTTAKPATPAPVAKPVAVVKPPASPTPASGDYKIQLGAFKSDSDARQTWSKITAKHGDVVKGSPMVMKADVKGTTYYRLRASGFGSADAAKRACATLSGRGQACMSVGK